jgi:3D (Asp-Asp-Asp) domain-containing protein
MEEVQHYLKRLSRRTIALGSIFFLCVICVGTLLLSPLSPTHADDSVPAWDGNFVTYQVGTQVSYDGNIYQCLQAHTSEPNWTPTATPALWQLESGDASTSVTMDTVTPTATEPYANGFQQFPGSTLTVTATPETQQPQYGMTAVSVTFYTDNGAMADGQQTHIGACAVYAPQFPLGTRIALYYPDQLSLPAYTCTAEDTGTHICQNDIDVALPGQVAEAVQLGVQQMQLQVVGFDSVIAQEAANNHYSSQGCELGQTH